MKLFDRIKENIEGFTMGVVATWGSSGAFVVQSYTK